VTRELTIEARGLKKSYGDFEAVKGVDIEVNAGEVVGFLGPNGAGKTTTVEVLEGYRPPTEGLVRVLGMEPATAGRALRERIGIVLQEAGFLPELTVQAWHRFFPNPIAVADAIERVGLASRAEVRVKNLSGASVGGSTSRSAPSAVPRCSSSTSRRPASIHPPAVRPGDWCASWSTRARRCV